MATKSKIKQLDRLLTWDREARLPETKNLYNKQVAETLFLREVREKLWIIESMEITKDGLINSYRMPIKHTTLIQLGLTILEAIEKSEKR